MDGSFRIGSLFGIPIQIHYTFLLVIPLFAWIIGSQISDDGRYAGGTLRDTD